MKPVWPWNDLHLLLLKLIEARCLGLGAADAAATASRGVARAEAPERLEAALGMCALRSRLVHRGVLGGWSGFLDAHCTLIRLPYRLY